MTKVFQHTDGRLIVVPEDGIEPTTGNGWGELIPKVTLDQALAKQPGWSARDALDEVAEALDTPVRVYQLTGQDVDAMLNHVLAVASQRTEKAKRWDSYGDQWVATALDRIAEALDQNIRTKETGIEAMIEHTVRMAGTRNEQAKKWQQVEAMITELADIMGCDGTASDVLKTAKRWTKLRHWLDEVIEASGHAPEITPSQPLIDRVVGSIQELRKRVGEQMDEARAEGAPRRHPRRDPVAQLATELYRMTTGGTELPAANPATADRYRRGARAILAAVRG